MKISYTDKVAPIQADGTVALFVVRNVEPTKIPDPTATTVTTDHGVKKLRKKVDALKITLSLVVNERESEPFQYIDFIPILSGWMGKLDALRIATGEDIASRDDFETDTLIKKDGYLKLTEKDGKNFVGRYLRPEDGETLFQK
jgi:hypothetical protein